MYGKLLTIFQINNFSISNIRNKKGQVIFKNNLTYKAPLLGSRSNRFWIDLKKFRE